MGETLSDSPCVGLTPSELETEIARVKRAGDVAYLDGDYEAARRWYGNMAELIAQRSDAVVAEMEKKMGLR